MLKRILVVAALVTTLFASPMLGQQATPPLTPEEKTLLESVMPILQRLITASEPVEPQEPVVVVHTATTMAELETAVAAALPGEIVQIEGTIVGNLELPYKTGWVTLRGGQVRSPSNAPAIYGPPGSGNWKLDGVTASSANPNGPIIRLGYVGSAQDTYEEVPGPFALKDVVVYGDPINGQKRGVELNSRDTVIENLTCTEIKYAGADTQCIGGWNGPGPYIITGGLMEASGENIMFGGSDPSVPGLIPSDITIVGVHLRKPLEWKGHASGWTIKNLFELKNAQRVVLKDSVLENNWLHAQTGYAVLLKSVNQDGNCNWCVVKDVTIENNEIINVSAGFNLHYGPPNNGYLGVPASGYKIINNYVQTNKAQLGGTGRFAMMTGPIAGVEIINNTTLTDGDAFFVDGDPFPGILVRGNIFYDRSYGIKGSGFAEGNASINQWFLSVGGIYEQNMFITPTPSWYPSTNGNVAYTALPTDLTGYGRLIQ